MDMADYYKTGPRIGRYYFSPSFDPHPQLVGGVILRWYTLDTSVRATLTLRW